MITDNIALLCTRECSTNMDNEIWTGDNDKQMFILSVNCFKFIYKQHLFNKNWFCLLLDILRSFGVLNSKWWEVSCKWTHHATISAVETQAMAISNRTATIECTHTIAIAAITLVGGIICGPEIKICEMIFEEVSLLLHTRILWNNPNSQSIDRPSKGNSFTQNLGQSNNQNFGNRSYNSNDGNQNSFSNLFGNDRFEQNNQNTNGNFYDDFDLNEFSKSISNNFDRQANNRNFNTRQEFGGNSNNDNNFGDSNWKSQQNQFNSRGGNNSSGNTNDRFNNNRNFQNNQDTRSGQHCIHMRGLPYYTEEMDVFNVGFTESNVFLMHSTLCYVFHLNFSVFCTDEAEFLQNYNQ